MSDIISRNKTAALKYANDEIPIIPLRSSGDTKAPHEMLGKKGGYKLASCDPDQIAAWWNRDPEANIGMALAPNGLIVVDADPGHNGIAKLAELEARYGALETAVIQDSGSGAGFHKVFLAPPGLRNPPQFARGDKANMGVDIKFNGYIVVAPSVHPRTGMRYKWRDGMCLIGQRAALKVLPDWVLVRAPGTGVATAAEDWTNAAMQRPVEDLEPDEIERIVMAIPPREDYHSWLEEGQALHHQFDGGVDGYELWDRSSARALAYNGNELLAKWNSFGKDGTRTNVTFRTLMQQAQEHETQQTTDEVEQIIRRLRVAKTGDEVEKIIKKQVKALDMSPILRAKVSLIVRETVKRITGASISARDLARMLRFEDKEATDMPVWLEAWAHIANTNSFFNLNTKQRITADAFNSVNNRRLLTHRERLEGKSVPETRASDFALNTHEIPAVHEAVYLPGQPEIFTFEGQEHANLFSEKSLPAMPDRLTAQHRVMVARMLGHLEHLIEDARDRETFLAWIGYQVQTLTRVNWSIVLQGCEGDGKTWWFVLMGAVLGSRNVTTISPQVLESGFTDWAHGHVFAAIEEIKLHGKNRHDVMNTLKPVITNDAIEIHPKGGKRFNAPNTQSYFLTTNYADAMPLDDGATRYFPIMSRWQQRPRLEAWMAAHPAYYADLYEVQKHGGALRRWFLDEYVLPAWFSPLNRAPKSASLAYMVEVSKTSDIQTLEDVLSDKPSETVSTSLLETTALAAAWHSVTDEIIPYGRALNRLLTEAGFTYLGRFRGGPDSAMRRYWSRAPERFVRDGKTDTKLVAKYAEEL